MDHRPAFVFDGCENTRFSADDPRQLNALRRALGDDASLHRHRKQLIEDDVGAPHRWRSKALRQLLDPLLSPRFENTGTPLYVRLITPLSLDSTTYPVASME